MAGGDTARAGTAQGGKFLLWGAAILVGAFAGWGIARGGRAAVERKAGAVQELVPPGALESFVRRATDRAPYDLACFESELDREAVAAYLRKQLVRQGWRHDPEFTRTVEEKSGRFLLSFERGGERLIAGIDETENGGTRVTNLSWRRGQRREVGLEK